MNLEEKVFHESLSNSKVENIFGKLKNFFKSYDSLVSNYEIIVESNNDIYEKFLSNIENAENNLSKELGTDTLNVGNPNLTHSVSDSTLPSTLSSNSLTNTGLLNQIIIPNSELNSYRTSPQSVLFEKLGQQNEYCKKVQQFLNSINQYLGQVNLNLEKNSVKQEELKKFSQTLIRAYSSRDSSILEQLNTTKIIDKDKDPLYTPLIELEQQYKSEIDNGNTETQSNVIEEVNPFKKDSYDKDENLMKFNSQLSENNNSYLDLTTFFDSSKVKEPFKEESKKETYQEKDEEQERQIVNSLSNKQLQKDDEPKKEISSILENNLNEKTLKIDNLKSKDIVQFSNPINEESILGIIYSDEKIKGHLENEYYKIISFINTIPVLKYINHSNIKNKVNNANFNLLDIYEKLIKKENNIINIEDFKLKLQKYYSLINILDKERFISEIKKEYDYIFFENFINNLKYIFDNDLSMDKINILIENLPEGFENNNLILLNYPNVVDGNLNIYEYIILISNSKKNKTYYNLLPTLILETFINKWTKFLQELNELVISPFVKELDKLQKKDYTISIHNKYTYLNNMINFIKNIIDKFSYLLKYYIGFNEKLISNKEKITMNGGSNTNILFNTKTNLLKSDFKNKHLTKKNIRLNDYINSRKIKKSFKKM